MTLWIHTLQGRDMSKESEDHSVMYRLADQLDGIADSLGLPKLSAFFDDTELKQEALGLMDEESAGEAPHAGDEDEHVDPETGWAYGIDDMTWYDRDQGLQTLEALRAHAASAESRITGRNATGLLEELEDCIAVLRAASAPGARFHIAIVP